MKAKPCYRVVIHSNPKVVRKLGRYEEALINSDCENKTKSLLNDHKNQRGHEDSDESAASSTAH